MIRRFNMFLAEITNERKRKASCGHAFISRKTITNESLDQQRSRRRDIIVPRENIPKRIRIRFVKEVVSLFQTEMVIIRVIPYISSISMTRIEILKTRQCILGKAVLMLSGICQFSLFKLSLTFEVSVLWKISRILNLRSKGSSNQQSIQKLIRSPFPINQ